MIAQSIIVFFLDCCYRTLFSKKLKRLFSSISILCYFIGTINCRFIYYFLWMFFNGYENICNTHFVISRLFFFQCFFSLRNGKSVVMCCASQKSIIRFAMGFCICLTSLGVVLTYTTQTNYSECSPCSHRITFVCRYHAHL